MKKLYPSILFFIVVVIIATSCATGNTAYKHGDYYKACLESIDRLRSNPKSSKSQDVLVKAYPLAQKTALREIDNAILANGTDKYEVLVFQYERLNELAKNIFNCPKAYELIPQPTQYIAELSKAKQMAADYFYEAGIKAMNYGTIDQARTAYQCFQNVNRYVNGYKDVQNRIADARYAATLRVLVQKPFLNQNMQFSADFFYNNLIAELQKSSQNHFVRYYSTEEAYRENMRNPHQFISLNFEEFAIGNIKESRDSRELSRDSVIVGQVKVEGKIYNSYNTVKAKLTTFRREISSSGNVSVRISDDQNRKELQRKNFSGSYTWETRWANFKGDDRAMTEEQKKLCTREPQIPPSDQDLFIEFTKPLFPQIISFVNSVYNRY